MDVVENGNHSSHIGSQMYSNRSIDLSSSLEHDSFSSNLDSDPSVISIVGETFSFQMPIKNLRLAFMGDSVTRYQYLSLVYFLKYGTWIDPLNNGRTNPLWHNNFDNWTDFFVQSNSILAPYEQCECHRSNNAKGYAWMKEPWFENRFYFDAVKNNSVAFVVKFGNQPARSNWPPHTVHTQHQNNGVILSLDQLPKNKTFVEYDWHQTIDEYISNIVPSYDVLVFNAGWWPHRMKNRSVQSEIIASCKQNNITCIYKTTNKSNIDNSTEMQGYERIMCMKANKCIDLSWTGKLSEEMYYDFRHPKEPVYRAFNSQLLYTLQQ